MRIIKTLVMMLLVSIFCSCGSNDTASPAAEPKPAELSIGLDYATSRNGSPDTIYQEEFTISRTAGTLTRRSGGQGNSGAWTTELNQVEIDTLNDLVTLAINPEVKDQIFDETACDGEDMKLVIGTSKHFYNGMVVDPITKRNQWHQFPVEATNLIHFLDRVKSARKGDRNNNER